MEIENRHAAAVANEVAASLARVDWAACETLAAAIVGARRTFLAGAGRSGLAMRAFAMRLMHMGFDSRAVGDVTAPAFGGNDLLIIGSASGLTATVKAVAELARAVPGGTLALLTRSPEGDLAKLCDMVIAFPKYGRNQALASRQPLGSLFEQSLFLALDSIVLMIMEHAGIDQGEMAKRHANLE